MLSFGWFQISLKIITSILMVLLLQYLFSLRLSTSRWHTFIQTSDDVVHPPIFAIQTP